MDIACHTNQKSTNFKYDVVGRSSLTALNNVVITSRAVPAPINLLLKPSSSGSINRVKYPNSHNTTVGMKVIKSWFANMRDIGSTIMYFVDSLVFWILLNILPIENAPTIEGPS